MSDRYPETALTCYAVIVRPALHIVYRIIPLVVVMLVALTAVQPAAAACCLELGGREQASAASGEAITAVADAEKDVNIRCCDCAVACAATCGHACQVTAAAYPSSLAVRQPVVSATVGWSDLLGLAMNGPAGLEPPPRA